jgi:hypothetical protein
MLKRYSKALAAIALACLGGTAYAGDQPAGTVVSQTNISACLTDCCPQNCGGVFGSAGILFLKSCANGDPAFSSFDCTYDNANPVTHATTVSNFDNGVDLGYRFEIGYHNGQGWGIRARYFKWESTSSVDTVDNLDDFRADAGLTSRKDTLRPLGLQFSSFGSDINPTFLNFNNRVRVEIWDVEVTRSTRCGCVDLTGSLGLRYLQTYQAYNASESLGTIPATPEFDQFGNDVTTIFQSQFIRSGHSNNGLGPVLGLEGRTTLWDNLRAYGMGRVGFIFGNGHQEAFKQVNFDPQRVPPGFPNPENTRAEANYDKLVMTYEVEAGLEYAIQLNGGSEVFLRGGLFGMSIGGIGNSSRSNVGAGTGESATDNLGLFGITANIGFRY